MKQENIKTKTKTIDFLKIMKYLWFWLSNFTHTTFIFYRNNLFLCIAILSISTISAIWSFTMRTYLLNIIIFVSLICLWAPYILFIFTKRLNDFVVMINLPILGASLNESPWLSKEIIQNIEKNNIKNVVSGAFYEGLIKVAKNKRIKKLKIKTHAGIIYEILRKAGVEKSKITEVIRVKPKTIYTLQGEKFSQYNIDKIEFKKIKRDEVTEKALFRDINKIRQKSKKYKICIYYNR